MSFNKVKAVQIADTYLNKVFKNDYKELDLLFEPKCYKKSQWRVSNEELNNHYVTPIHMVSVDLLLDDIVISTYSLYFNTNMDVLDEFFINH